MLKKLLFFLSFILAGVLLLSGFTYVYIKNNDVSKQLKTFVLNQINKQLEGELELDDFAIDFLDGKVIIEAEDLKLKDKDKKLVCELDQFISKFNPVNLLKLKLHLDSLEATALELDLIRDLSGEWNINKILKQKEKKTNLLSLDYLNIDQINISIEDQIQENKIKYQDLQFKLQKEKKKDRFMVNLCPIDSIDKSLEGIDKNNQESQIILNGLINFKNNFYKDEDFYLNTEFNKLAMANIEFLLAAFLSQEDCNLITEKIKELDAENTLFNGEIKINREEEHLRIHLNQVLEGFANANETKINSNLTLAEDIKLNNLNLSFDNEQVSLSGDIKEWQNKHRVIDLSLIFENTNLDRLINKKLLFLKNKIARSFLQKISVLSNNKLISGKINFKINDEETDIEAKVPLSQYSKLSGKSEEKVLSAHLSINKKLIKLINLNIPYKHTEMNIEGDYNKESENYNFKIFTKDFPIGKMKVLLSDLENDPRYSTYLKDTLIKGYTSLDLHISNNELKGTCKIANGNYKGLNFPISIDKLNADLVINNRNYQIKKLNGFIDKKYFSGEGEITLVKKNEKPLINALILANELNLKNIYESGLLESFQFKNILPEELSGTISDLQVSISNKINKDQYQIEGNFHIDDMDLLLEKDLPRVTDLNGDINLSQDLITADSLKAKVNDAELESAFTLNRSSKLEKFSLKALNAKTQDALNFLFLKFPNLKGKIISGKGFADLDLNYEPGNFSITTNFINSGASFDVPKFHQYVQNLNGEVSYANKTIDFKDLKIKIADSETKVNGSLENTIENGFDPLINLDLDGYLNSKFLKSYIPESILVFFKFDGALKSKVNITGNKSKQIIDVKAFFNELDSLKLSTWLDIDKSTISRGRTKIIATPDLIVSDDTKVVFQTSKENKVKLRGRYQVKDWRDKDKITYEIFVKTEDETPERKNKLQLLYPHLSVLHPFNLAMSGGTFLCDTYGSYINRLSLCKFDFEPATSQKFGIGDLYSDKTKIDMVSLNGKPLEMQFSMDSGNWNKLPYKNVSFDLAVDETYSHVKNLKTEIMQGKGEADIKFNYRNFESEFNVEGFDLPAHEIAESVWALGNEIPEGLLNINFKGKTKGIMPDEIFFNLEGVAHASLENGKLSQLKSMQKILTAINTFKSFDVNNVIQTLITLEGGKFNHLFSSLIYDHGKVSTDKALLKASNIELIGNGYIDYAKDYQDINGKGMIPKYSESVLTKLGVGGANLGNLASLVNLNVGKKKKEKRFFKFKAAAKASDPDAVAKSIRDNFMWLEDKK